MLTDINLITDSAMALPLDAKEVLIRKLVESINESDEQQLPPEWRAEVDRRLRDYRDGKSKSLPLDEVVSSIRRGK